MAMFVLRRTAESFLVLFVLISLVFLAGRVIGDPVLVMLGPEATQASQDAMRERLGLANPLVVQYWHFITDIFLRGDFGESFWQRQPALPIAISRVPATLYLAFISMAIAIPVAIGLGTWSALRPRSVIDRAINVFSLAGVSVVDFWLALMMVYFFSVQLGWLPTAGYGGGKDIILPAVALAYRSIGRLAQFTRSALLDEYAKPYVKMARAKGLSERRIFIHVIKNAAIPIVTLCGDEIAGLANGSVVIETVFAWPGIGSLIVLAINQRDLVLLEASVAVVGVIIITVNLLVDLTYSYLNPKVRQEVG